MVIKHSNEETVENIVFNDFDKDAAFEDESQFKIILIDRYGLRYEKIFEASEIGNTDVSIEESDYVKQSGDWKRKFGRTLNG